MLSCSAIAAALIAATPGSTVATGPITCPNRITITNMRAKIVPGAVTLDATGALFNEGIAFSDVHGITIKGGTYGQRDRDTLPANRTLLQVSGSSDISIAGATFLGAPGTARMDGSLITGDRNGIQFRNSTRVTARDNRFYGFRTGLSLYEVTDFLAARNSFNDAVSDGIQVVGSHNGVVSANTCHWLKRIGNAHPDCIQLWSLKGKPLQSDVWVVNNYATGMMQGILSSDPKVEPGSGTRLHFHGNYMAVIFAHTITCGLCSDSVATDNVLASYPGSFFGIGRLKGFEPARGNTVARNVMRDGTKTLPPRLWWWGKLPTVGSVFDSRVPLASSGHAGSVP